MAFDLTWADVVKIAPDLSSLTTDEQNAVLADVDVQLSESYLGNKYDLACKYLAAHLGTLVKRKSDGPAGSIASESVGSMSRSFAVAAMTDEALSATAWGRQYKAIVRQLQYRVGVVL